MKGLFRMRGSKGMEKKTPFHRISLLLIALHLSFAVSQSDLLQFRENICFAVQLPFVSIKFMFKSFHVSSVGNMKDTNTGASRNLKEIQQEVHCSRERSRAAWKIVEEYLMPFVEKENYILSSRCRLHASNDLFRDQEEHKIHVDINEWRCGYCKKIFRAEKYLDQHFDNRHYNLLNVSHGKCLANLCGALHCDYVINSQSHKAKCNPAAAARNRHLCEDLANNCFPVSEGPSATRLHEFFLHQFCDGHSCSRGKKPFSRGGKKHTSILYLATSVLILMFLPIFYLIVYLYQREMKKGTTQLKRISRPGRKPKPS